MRTKHARPSQGTSVANPPVMHRALGVGIAFVLLAACSAAPSDDEDVADSDGLAQSTECSGSAILARIPEGPRHDAVARAVWRVGTQAPYSPAKSSGGYRNDCSGFVAMVWQDPKQPSTQGYPPFKANPGFAEIPFAELQPGDALNRPTLKPCSIGMCGHIRLFGGFVDAEKTRFCVLEHAGPSGAPPLARLGKSEDVTAYRPIKNLSLPDVGGAPPTPPPPPPVAGCGELGVNEALGVDQAKLSCDGRFALVMQADGNLVLYQGGTALWSSRTVGAGGTTAIMQGDGNFVVYQDGMKAAVWNSHTNGHAGATLRVQDDGNVVVGSGGAVYWASGTGGH